MATTVSNETASKLAQALGASKVTADKAVATVAGGGGSSKPAYNAATGATTGTPSKEYDTYLKSLNKKGSSNYVPTPDDKGYENMDAISNAKIGNTPTNTITDPTTPITPATPYTQNAPGSLNDTEVQSLSTQGFTEGANVPGRGTLLPDGTFKQSSGGDLASTYQSVAANPPTGVDMQNVSDASQAANTAVTTAQGAPKPAGGQEIMDYFDNDENKELSNIEKMYNKFYSPQNQKTNLMDTYRQMVSSTGLDDINEELIDAKNIIDGSEEDIRTEITKAGGFATESQVQGMTNARNKSLIKNYNTLLETKNAITEQIGNMMQYAQADRTYAAQQFESRMNFEMKKVEYGIQAQQYASSQLWKMQEAVGFQGLLDQTNGDPYSIAKIEQAMGLSQGGLAEAASIAQPGDYQFISGTDNQPMGVFDKTTGDFTSLGYGGGGSGGAGDIENLIAYAQQYASTGTIPTGLPKGTFGSIAAIAGELPKVNGEIVDNNTNVKSSKLTPTLVDGYSAMKDLTSKIGEANILFNKLHTGFWGGTFGNTFTTKDRDTYNVLKCEIVDLLARDRTGAAISATEEALYKSKIPGTYNETFFIGQSGDTKLKGLQKSIEDKLDAGLRANGVSMYGFSKVELGGTKYNVGEIIESNGMKGRVNPNGSITIIQ